jgi:hypothetical protein
MDADKVDDIVYATDAGNIGILYGKKQSKIDFTPVLVESGYGVTLINTASAIGGAITF